jgi:uncharacterized protein DUF6152
MQFRKLTLPPYLVGTHGFQLGAGALRLFARIGPVRYSVRERNMASRSKTALSIAFACLCAAPLLAHHSFGAEYDAQRPVTLTGVVTKVEWTNPHCHFYVDVADDKGTIVNWKFEGYGIGVLYRNGWKRDVTIKPGDKVTVTGWGARDGGPWAHSREVTLADGKKMFYGPPAGTGDGGSTPAVEVR